MGESQETFSVLVPERWMRPGCHRIRLFEVTRRNGSFLLTPIGENA
jgi:hypothetical protein